MLNETEDRKLFDRISKSYARKDLYPSSSLPRKQLLLNALKPLMKEKNDLGNIVDIGCGIGAAARYLSGYYTSYIGIDQSSPMVKAARYLHRNNRRTRFITENIKSMQKLPNNSADLILSIGALHHMTELDRVMKSLHWMASENCTFVAIEPQNGNPFIQLSRYIRGILDPAYSAEQIFFSESQLTGLFRRHQLEDIATRYFGIFSTPFAELIIKPQILSIVLSRGTNALDNWLYEHLPASLGRICFKIIVCGRFRK